MAGRRAASSGSAGNPRSTGTIDNAIELRDSDTVDVAASFDDVYNDVRVRAVDASARATPGIVFGAEITVESRSVFLQFEWSLQDRTAVDLARRTLRLPAGWTATSVTFNHTPSRSAPSISRKRACRPAPPRRFARSRARCARRTPSPSS